MPSFKSIATGLVALLAADAVIAGPCRPSVTTTSVSASTDTETSSVSTETTNSATTETSTSAGDQSSSTTETISSITVTSSEISTVTETSVSETETVSSSEISSSSTIQLTTETATSTEISTASSTESSTETTTAAETTTTTEEVSTTSSIASTSTSEAPATLPTIYNANFDDNSNGAPWVRTGSASVSNGAVFWKYSEPNVMTMRPGTAIAQEITGLRPNLAYRIRFPWVEFDTPSATGGCRLTVTFGGENIGEVLNLPPRTPNNVFEEFVSSVYRPSTTSAELKIAISCTAPSQMNRYYVEDVSIEFAE